jgi:hypothetical protein
MKVLNKVYVFNIVAIITCLTLSLCTGSVYGQLNPGFENTSTSAGWTATGTPNGGFNRGDLSANIRSGYYSINTRWIGTTSTTADIQHTSYSVTVPGAGYYVHVIGWVRGDVNVSTGVGIFNVTTSASTNSALAANSSFTRVTASVSATASQSYIPKFRASNSNSIGNKDGFGDDFIIYYTTQSTVDLTQPNAATSLCVNTSGSNNVLTWTDGTDVATNTSGISGTLILRAPFGTALPTVLDQAYYSTSSQTGPSTIGSWTVLENSTSSGTYTDVGAAGQPYIYAVYMRDNAYNYSATATSFSTANAGSDQTLACSATTATMAATAATGGAWSLISGGGTITTGSSATSGLTALSVGTNIFRWTVTNAGCSTYDNVSIIGTSALPTKPTNIQPANGSNYSPFGVVLAWANGGGAASYVVNTGTSSPPGTAAASQTSTIFGYGDLTGNTTYYWRVDATNVCGTTTGDIWSFTTFPEFANTTASACDTWNSGNTYTGFTKSISVTGLPTPLGTSTGKYVLNEVEVELGNSARVSCNDANLSTYDFRLTAPDGTTYIDFFPTNKLTTGTSDRWIKAKFRDHSSLSMINEYAATSQTAGFPYSIGYYGIETDNGFQTTFNGLDPNGTWTFAIKENSSTEISFVSVKLKFGPKILLNDIKTSNSYDNCTSAQCIDSRQITVATNNGFQSADPILTAITPDGSCGFNGANNNSAWFQFTASSTTAYLTVSGMDATGNNTQLVVIQKPVAGCVDQGSSWVIPTGGCLNTSNNTAYLTANGGGNFTYSSSGMSLNTEFNLSGLTIGQVYYLYIDGMGGASSDFYINAFSGCQTCDNNVVVLSVDWYSFNPRIIDKTTHINWQTASEKENDYFQIERSKNGVDWEYLDRVEGSGNTHRLTSYGTYDFYPYQGVSYYRIKQVDYNGKFSMSEIKSVYNTAELMIVPNPNNGIFGIGGLSKDQINYIKVIDLSGKPIFESSTSDESFEIDLTAFLSGLYYVVINDTETLKVIKN